MNIFNSLDYKEMLRGTFEDRKTAFHQVSYQDMANSCKVQKTYLSKVLNHDGNLNSDQLFLACKYLNLDEEQTNYVSLVHQYQLCQIAERKSALKKQIQEFQNRTLQTESNISSKEVVFQTEVLSQYYADPLFVIIHICLTVESFKKNPLKLASSLRISETQLIAYLKRLEQMKIISVKDGKYQILRDNLHLTRESALYKPYKAMMRLKAIEQMDSLAQEDFYSFSVVFSTSAKVRRSFQEKFLGILKELQEEMTGEPEDGVYQINFDLVNWITPIG